MTKYSKAFKQSLRSSSYFYIRNNRKTAADPIILLAKNNYTMKLTKKKIIPRTIKKNYAKTIAHAKKVKKAQIIRNKRNKIIRNKRNKIKRNTKPTARHIMQNQQQWLRQYKKKYNLSSQVAVKKKMKIFYKKYRKYINIRAKIWQSTFIAAYNKRVHARLRTIKKNLIKKINQNLREKQQLTLDYYQEFTQLPFYVTNQQYTVKEAFDILFVKKFMDILTKYRKFLIKTAKYILAKRIKQIYIILNNNVKKTVSKLLAKWVQCAMINFSIKSDKNFIDFRKKKQTFRKILHYSSVKKSLRKANTIPRRTLYRESRYKHSGRVLVRRRQVKIITKKKSILKHYKNGKLNRKKLQKPAEQAQLSELLSLFKNKKSVTQTPVTPTSLSNLLSSFKNKKSITQTAVMPTPLSNLLSSFKNKKSITQTPVMPTPLSALLSSFKNKKLVSQKPTKQRPLWKSLSFLTTHKFRNRKPFMLKHNPIRLPDAEYNYVVTRARSLAGMVLAKKFSKKITTKLKRKKKYNSFRKLLVPTVYHNILVTARIKQTLLNTSNLTVTPNKSLLFYTKPTTTISQFPVIFNKKRLHYFKQYKKMKEHLRKLANITLIPKIKQYNTHFYNYWNANKQRVKKLARKAKIMKKIKKTYRCFLNLNNYANIVCIYLKKIQVLCQRNMMLPIAPISALYQFIQNLPGNLHNAKTYAILCNKILFMPTQRHNYNSSISMLIPRILSKMSRVIYLKNTRIDLMAIITNIKQAWLNDLKTQRKLKQQLATIYNKLLPHVSQTRLKEINDYFIAINQNMFTYEQTLYITNKLFQIYRQLKTINLLLAKPTKITRKSLIKTRLVAKSMIYFDRAPLLPVVNPVMLFRNSIYAKNSAVFINNVARFKRSNSLKFLGETLSKYLAVSLFGNYQNNRLRRYSKRYNKIRLRRNKKWSKRKRKLLRRKLKYFYYSISDKYRKDLEKNTKILGNYKKKKLYRTNKMNALFAKRMQMVYMLDNRRKELKQLFASHNLAMPKIFKNLKKNTTKHHKPNQESILTKEQKIKQASKLMNEPTFQKPSTTEKKPDNISYVIQPINTCNIIKLPNNTNAKTPEKDTPGLALDIIDKSSRADDAKMAFKHTNEQPSENNANAEHPKNAFDQTFLRLLEVLPSSNNHCNQPKNNINTERPRKTLEHQNDECIAALRKHAIAVKPLKNQDDQNEDYDCIAALRELLIDVKPLKNQDDQDEQNEDYDCIAALREILVDVKPLKNQDAQDDECIAALREHAIAVKPLKNQDDQDEDDDCIAALREHAIAVKPLKNQDDQDDERFASLHKYAIEAKNKCNHSNYNNNTYKFKKSKQLSKRFAHNSHKKTIIESSRESATKKNDNAFHTNNVNFIIMLLCYCVIQPLTSTTETIFYPQIKIAKKICGPAYDATHNCRSICKFRVTIKNIGSKLPSLTFTSEEPEFYTTMKHLYKNILELQVSQHFMAPTGSPVGQLLLQIVRLSAQVKFLPDMRGNYLPKLSLPGPAGYENFVVIPHDSLYFKNSITFRPGQYTTNYTCKFIYVIDFDMN